jgi:hypothetical protein
LSSAAHHFDPFRTPVGLALSIYCEERFGHLRTALGASASFFH